jgi:hypothetical protein
MDDNHLKEIQKYYEENKITIHREGPTDTNNPWQFHPEYETSRDYFLFQIYAELGVERTVEKVREEIIKKTNLKPLKTDNLKRISTKNSWVERATAWDAYKLKEWTRTRQDRVREMCEQHTEDTHTFHKAIMTEMLNTSKTIPPEKVAYYYDAMARAYERMARLERISNGEIVDFDGLRLDTDYSTKDLDKLLKDPDLTSDLSTLLTRVDGKIADIKRNNKKKET